MSLSLLRRSTASAADMVRGNPPKRLYRFFIPESAESILGLRSALRVSVMIFIRIDWPLIAVMSLYDGYYLE